MDFHILQKMKNFRRLLWFVRRSSTGCFLIYVRMVRHFIRSFLSMVLEEICEVKILQEDCRKLVNGYFRGGLNRAAIATIFYLVSLRKSELDMQSRMESDAGVCCSQIDHDNYLKDFRRNI